MTGAKRKLFSSGILLVTLAFAATGGLALARETVSRSVTVVLLLLAATLLLSLCALWQIDVRTGKESRYLLDALSEGVLAADGAGQIVFANRAASELLGHSTSYLTGKNLHSVLHAFSREMEPCTVETCSLLRSLAHGEAMSGRATLAAEEAGTFPADYMLAFPANQAGVVLSFRNVREQEAVERGKDEFISTVSHELRTPLTSIRGALGLLSSGLLAGISPKAADLLRIAEVNSERLIRLINDILDLERIQSGRAALSFRPCLLATVIRQAMDSIRPMADEAGVRLIAGQADITIEADPDRLVQILINLLSNAVKFSPSGSVVVVSVGSTVIDSIRGAQLSVRDQGRGVPEDKLETIFDRFQQVDAADSRQKGGTGLGLAICRTLAHQHGGCIWAERNPDRGTTFSVFLPYTHTAGMPEVLCPPPKTETGA